jgi:hypothetical protein
LVCGPSLDFRSSTKKTVVRREGDERQRGRLLIEVAEEFAMALAIICDQRCCS